MTPFEHPSVLISIVLGPGIAHLSIEVEIDAAGQPDMRTLRVTGRAAAEHRPVIEEWILRARFQPASRNGEPVPGLLTTAVRSRRGDTCSLTERASAGAHVASRDATSAARARRESRPAAAVHRNPRYPA